MGYLEIGDVIVWFKEVLEYNVIGGKYNWGLMVVVVFWELVELRKQDVDSFQWVWIVGWCVELL